MATTTKATKSFKLSCPFCGEAEPVIKLYLNDLTELVCDSCDAEFTPAEAVAKAAEQLKRWVAMAKWIGMAGEIMAE